VNVLVIRPGPVDTGFRRHAIATDGPPGVRPVGAAVQSPEHVAARVVRAIDQRQAVVETSGFVRVASAAARMAPRTLQWIGAAMAARSRDP
jgi:short-subunit dehydrogenase